jgi:phage tail-like protein
MTYPLTSFNFTVEIYPDGDSKPLAEAAFADCDGLELTMDVKTVREGGANDRAYRVPGVINYANLTLKRGMTGNLDLWKWVQRTIADPGLRANAEVVVFQADGTTEAMRYQLHRCLPIKFKAPMLSAKDGQIAIEEFQLAYEKFDVVAPKGAAA